MGAQLTADEIMSNAITYGRATVRIVEAADMLLSRGPSWTEKLLLKMVLALYRRRLRQMVKVLPPEMTAEILAASEKMTGVVRGFTDN